MHTVHCINKRTDTDTHQTNNSRVLTLNKEQNNGNQCYCQFNIYVSCLCCAHDVVASIRTYVMACMYLMCQYDFYTLLVMLQQKSTIASIFAIVVVGSVSVSVSFPVFAFLFPHCCYYLFRFVSFLFLFSVPCLFRVLIAAEIGILCHDKLAAQ